MVFEKYVIAVGLLVVLLLVFIMAGLALLGAKSRQGAPRLGLHNGQLTACASSPNCVCSEFIQDASHFVAPLPLTSVPIETAMSWSSQVVLQLGGEVTYQDQVYLSAVFKSRLFGFVDDFELRLDTENNVLQFRSSARVGHSDFGSNAARVHHFKQAWQRMSEIEADP